MKTSDSQPPDGIERELETELRCQKEALERSNTLLTAVLESPEKIVIFALDRSYRYTAFNANHQRTMKTIWGVDIEVGMNMLDLIKNPADRDKAKDNFDRALAGECFTKVEAYGEPPNRYIYEDVYNPILDEQGEVIGLTLFLTDITDKQAAEEKLRRYHEGLEELVDERTAELRKTYERLEEETLGHRRTEELLRQSQRLEALGTLAGGVAHDFNNILTAIVGYSDLLAFELPEEGRHREYLDKIKAAGRSGASVTSRLLAFSRRQVLKPSPLDLTEVVEDLSSLFRHLLPEVIEVATDLEAASRTVRADRGQIEQVIMNLALNGRDAMPDGGVLTIRTRSLDQAPAGSPEHAADADGFVCLEVEDTGEGIEARDLERIFDPFFTTKETGKGSGLGLSVIYGIVHQHGGWVDVESEPGRGSRFVVFLPAQGAALPEDQIQPRTREPVDADSGGRILVVEDDDGIRTMAKTLLSEHGFEVVEAATHEGARAAFDEADGLIDLLFSDVVLPDRDGVELALALATERPGMPILLTSGYGDTRIDAEALLRLPSYRFLSKPYQPQRLLRVVTELLGEGRDPGSIG